MVVVGLGKHALPALKEGLDGFGNEAAKPTPLLEVHAANAWFADESPAKLDPALKPEQRGGRLSLTGGKEARLHLELDARLLCLVQNYLRLGKESDD